MKKPPEKLLRRGALVLACLLVVGVLLFANIMVGNPISHLLARRTGERYLAEKYPDTGYEIKRVSFNFKDTCYHVYLTDPANMDGDFTLTLNMAGKLLRDDYDYRVTRHGNLHNRLYFAYREQVRGVLESTVFPREVEICYSELHLGEEKGTATFLENNRMYDLQELGRQYGEIVLHVTDKTVTPARAAEILLEVKTLTEIAGVRFATITFSLRAPRVEGVPYRGENTLQVERFPIADIYAEGLAERIVAADAARAAADTPKKD